MPSVRGLKRRVAGLVATVSVATGCAQSKADEAAMVPPDLPQDGTSILYLHHSTGQNIWEGGIPQWVQAHNAEHGTRYHIVERAYPDKPYPWSNDPYDYWKLWVDNGTRSHRGQATLEQLAAAYDVIVWKNCYVASHLEPDEATASVSSKTRTEANYRLQFEALKAKMGQFPQTTFIVWTLPPLVAGETNPQAAARSQSVSRWLVDEWDKPGDNIHVWDFHSIAARDGLLPAEYATGEKDSHPNPTLAKIAAPMFGRRLVDVVEGRGDTGPKTG